MASLPLPLLQQLESVPGYNRENFEQVHASGEQITSVRLNPYKPVSDLSIISNSQSVSWCTHGYYLDKRPSFTFDPLFHAGAYYVQEASSMFLEQAFLQAVDRSGPLRVLDLCASPGGKSTHLLSLLPPDSYLVSNEVIRSRAGILRDNIVKWGVANAVVTNNDPRDFARLEQFFDVILVDAPCSGSGLFRRDPEAIQEWSEDNVALCAPRQQRILADALPALKAGGVLIYATCSYSPQEDEELVRWLQENQHLSLIPLEIPDNWKIVTSEGGFRFWPDQVKGEGFFLSCFRKTGITEDPVIRAVKKPVSCSRKENEIISSWVKGDDLQFIRHEQTVYAWPSFAINEWSMLLEKLKVVRSGILSGELIRETLVPDHALAMSVAIADGVQRIDLEEEDAIRYLQKKDFAYNSPYRGWVLVGYKGLALGWIKSMPNRINNYYPMELRILKDK